MKTFNNNYKRVIATKELSKGNDRVGDMWTETKSFDRDTPIHQIIYWANDCSGKLTITVDDPINDVNNLDRFKSDDL